MSLVVAIVLLGLLASVSPSTIVVFILLLSTTRARVNATAFFIGWGISLVIVFAVTYAVGGDRAVRQGTGSTVAAVLEILLGITLGLLAARQWRRRNEPGTGSGVSKKLTARMKKLSPWEAATVGILKQPWTLTAAAAVVLVRHHSAFVIAVVSFLAFTLLSTATVGLIFLYFARRPGEAEAHLSALRDRLTQAGPAIFAIVCVAVGAFLIADGAHRYCRTVTAPVTASDPWPAPHPGRVSSSRLPGGSMDCLREVVLCRTDQRGRRGRLTAAGARCWSQPCWSR